MNIIVHHKPVRDELSWDMHVWQAAWDGNSVWDSHGTLKEGIIDFQLPDVPNPRKLQFKYRSTDSTGRTVWEPDDFIRRVFQTPPTEIWTFDSSGRVLCQHGQFESEFPTLSCSSRHFCSVHDFIVHRQQLYASNKVLQFRGEEASIYVPKTPA